MYTGTCALFDANNAQGDGNTGWACYNKAEKHDFGFMKQKAIESMAIYEEDVVADEAEVKEDLFIF